MAWSRAVDLAATSPRTSRLAPGDGAKDGSLYHADNLDSAIKTYTDKFGTDGISMVKIEPNSMKVTTSGGINVVTKDGDTQGLNLPSGVTVPNIGGGSDVSLADVDTSAPQKIVDSLKDKGVTFANVNYFLISPALTSVVSDGSSSAPGWLIYSEKGNFQAKADGSGAKPLGSGSVSITTPDGTSVDTKKLEDQAKKATDQAKTIASQADQRGQGHPGLRRQGGHRPAEAGGLRRAVVRSSLTL